MTDFKIVFFVCNWGPHAAYHMLQDTGANIPEEVSMVRIPCSGRISKALLFKPFEMGADGVALIGCESGTCRYGSGTLNAQMSVEDTRGILQLLGLGENRLRFATFMPDESAPLHKFVKSFRDEIVSLGKSPVTSPAKTPAFKDIRDQVKQVVAVHDVYACQDCGKCSSACPLTLVGKPFSPRAIANSIIAGDLGSERLLKDVWSCLTCGLCYDRCPSAVNFSQFIKEIRALMKQAGVTGLDAHGGFLQSLMRTMASKDLKIRHWDWLPDDIKINPDSKQVFFGGCAPYFDLFFRKYLGIQTRSILEDSLRLLNFFDILPSVLDGERCCGHDLLWSGDRENYLRLAKLNVETMHEAGIEELVTACPECYWTFSHDYPKQGVDVNFKVTHIYDLLETEIDKGAVGFKHLNRKITFQDPCRLSRLQDRSGLPRKLISRLDTAGFAEMKDFGASGMCCGNSAWTGCDSFSKALQVKRLGQARETGSDMLVTACPKCQIHLRCAMEDPFRGEELDMELADLTNILARTIQWE